MVGVSERQSHHNLQFGSGKLCYDCGMIHRCLGKYICGALLAVSVMFSVGLNGHAQSNAAIEFTARIKPTSARAEPVREISFYLLRKSLAEIRKEAEQAESVPDMDHFVDGLDVSVELKKWMKSHHTVQLSGGDFTKLLTADDIVAVPEFVDAYTKQNGADLGGGVPPPPYKERDREKNPEKYQRQREQYKQGLHRYIVENPDSIQGIDVQLREKDPGPRWLVLVNQQQQRVRSRFLKLAQTQYFVAQSDTDLNGSGAFKGVAPGTYWITTLDTPALAGDAQLRWDLTVTVGPGEIKHVELSNLNALESASLTAP